MTSGESINDSANGLAAEIPSQSQTPSATQHLWNSPGTWIGLGAAVAILTLTLLMFIGLYLARQKTGELAHRLNIMEAQMAVVSALDSRVTALEHSSHSTPAESQQHSADIGSQGSEIAALTQKIQELQLSSSNKDTMAQTLAGLQQTVASLQTNLQTLSQSFDATRAKVGDLDIAITQKKNENARQFALLLGIDRLREAAATSQPFVTELAFGRTLAGDDAEIAKPLDELSPYAKEGAPTLNELRVEFADQASEIVRSNVVGDGKSSFRQALYRLGSVVSVRKVGNVTTHNPAETAVAQAESKLEEDDLAGAVKALGGLSGLPADVASGWIDAATRRVAVDDAMNALSETALRRLADFQAAPGSHP